MSETTVLNFGSLNIDLVYRVPHFIEPGETLACTEFNRFSGGKGLNQSVALARAGVTVFHAGKIGPDGAFLEEMLKQAGAHTDFLLHAQEPTGHAVIEVDSRGGNRILLYPGTNAAITKNEIISVLDRFEKGTILLLQNEISNAPFLIEEAWKRGFYTVFNPSPCTPEILQMPLQFVRLFFVNEIEAAQLSGLPQDTAPQNLADALCGRYPDAEFVITLGAAGALYAKRGEKALFVPAEKVKAVDTTSAGDTFTGYYLASVLRGFAPADAMRFAAKASAITVSRPGAAPSIPSKEEVFGI